MSEESAPAPSQGIGAWIVSGSVALVMVIGGAVAFNSPDKSTEEGNPTPNQTVAPGGGHSTGPSRDTAAQSVTDSTEAETMKAEKAAGVLGAQVTVPDTTGRDSGNTASRAPRVWPAAPPVLPARNPSENVPPEVGPDSETTRLNGLAPAPDAPAPVAVDADQAAQITETPEAPEQTPVPSEPDPEAEMPGGARVPSEPGTHSLNWQENGQQFSAQVNVGQDGQVTVIDPDGTPDRYAYDPAVGRLTAIATPAPLVDTESGRPPAPVDLSGEPTQSRSTEASATPISATQILTESTETEQSEVEIAEVEITEVKQPRGDVTETKQSQVETAETQQTRVETAETKQTLVEVADTEQPQVVETRTWPTGSQAQSEPTKTAPRIADEIPAAGATTTTSTCPAPAG